MFGFVSTVTNASDEKPQDWDWNPTDIFIECLFLLLFFCSWKPIFLLIHKSWCSACQGQYTHNLPKLLLEPNLTPCKAVCIRESRKFLLDKSGIQLEESGIPVPLTRIWNPGCLGFSYMGWKISCASCLLLGREKKSNFIMIILQRKLHSIDNEIIDA